MLVVLGTVLSLDAERVVVGERHIRFQASYT
jgi:hypothetical protein